MKENRNDANYIKIMKLMDKQDGIKGLDKSVIREVLRMLKREPVAFLDLESKYFRSPEIQVKGPKIAVKYYRKQMTQQQLDILVEEEKNGLTAPNEALARALQLETNIKKFENAVNEKCVKEGFKSPEFKQHTKNVMSK